MQGKTSSSFANAGIEYLLPTAKAKASGQILPGQETALQLTVGLGYVF